MAHWTKEELEALHPDYESFAADWEFYRDSYYGGSMYRNGDYLLQHPFESSANYERRKQIAYFYNYCKPIIDIFVSHLYRKPPKRDFGSLAEDPLFQNFQEDADLDGNTLDQFMRDASRLAGIYGRVTIVVDKPAVNTLTQRENLDDDIRPYVKMIAPQNVLDWAFVRLNNGRVVLDWVKIQEGDNYRIWTREGWQLWTIETDEKDNWFAKLIEEGEHDLGVVPIVNLYNIQAETRFIGLSDITDISDINKNIYYLCSDAKEIIENTAFPMLAIPFTKAESVNVGTTNIIQFDPEVTGKPFWLEPPNSSLKEIREWVTQDINEIHRIAKLGGVRSSEDFAQARSGVAIQLEQQQLHATLAEKADNLEKAEEQIMTLWAAWEGKTWDGDIDYPDEFSVNDLDSELDRAIKSTSVNVQSVTFNKERQKAVAKTVLPKASDEIKKQINDEIDLGLEPTIVTPLATTLGVEEVTDGDSQ